MLIQRESGPVRIVVSDSEDRSPAHPPSLGRTLPARRNGWPRWCRRWFDRPKAGAAVRAGVPPRRVSIATVALPAAAEARLREACLAAEAATPGCRIALSPWHGQRADVVIAAWDDLYGRLVCTLAAEAHSRVVPLRAGAPGLARRGGDGAFRPLSRAALHALIADLCREVLAHDRTDAAPAAPTAGAPAPGLPPTSLLSQAIQHERSGWLCLGRGQDRIRIHRVSSRLQAASPRSLDVAGLRLLDPGWRRAAPDPAGDVRWIETSLDLFLLRACLQHRAALPRLDAMRFRMAHWPDLVGEAPMHAWVLPLMETVVRQGPVGPPDLSAPNAVSAAQVNAMCWAFWASGVLDRVAMPGRQRPAWRAAPPPAPAPEPLRPQPRNP